MEEGGAILQNRERGKCDPRTYGKCDAVKEGGKIDQRMRKEQPASEEETPKKGGRRNQVERGRRDQERPSLRKAGTTQTTLGKSGPAQIRQVRRWTSRKE